MRKRTQRGEIQQAGFTLLEVLVATAVLGTAVAALFSLLSGALANARRLQAPERALALARTQLEELLATSERGRHSPLPLPLDQKIQGRWDDQFRWEALATRVESSAQPAPGTPVLVRIALDAYWSSSEGAPEKQVALETYQLWQEPARSAP